MEKLKTILLVLMPAFVTMLSLFCFLFLGDIHLVNGWYVAGLIAFALSFLTAMYKVACNKFFVFASKMYSIIGVLSMFCLCFRHYHILYTFSIVVIVLLCVLFWVKILNESKDAMRNNDVK